ncbi:glycosyltransferase family 4 protein [Paenibacillus pinistramenti]|uniref:glycosyltransferase family 4 protein n=1 Tax=Paenibacillus pinistramenti TaxID=1768003 RepID=UPI0011081FDD|nr:glycosyltransferase family 4 protein [Paenibacillus pinistramenti]
MKVLFVFYIPSGGVETLNRHRCRALKEAGITTHLLYLLPGKGMQNIKDIPTFITNKNDEIAQILKEGNYSAVIVVSAHPYLKRIRSLGYSGLLFWEVQGYVSKEGALEEFRIASLDVLQYCNGVVYPETAYIKEIAAHFFPPEMCFSFHNCMDFESFAHRALPREGGPVMGWVGRIEENKNWRDFLRIGHKLREQHPQLKLWMFEDSTLSEPGQRTQFIELVKNLGLGGSLTILDNIPNAEMPNYYSRIADSGGFLCSTSKVEGFGYAVLEAICCQCPVLSTDSDGVRSFIIHNETGKFYPHGDVDQAVREANSLMKDRQLRSQITAKAYERARLLFDSAAYSRNFRQMLEQAKRNNSSKS